MANPNASGRVYSSAAKKDQEHGGCMKAFIAALLLVLAADTYHVNKRIPIPGESGWTTSRRIPKDADSMSRTERSWLSSIWTLARPRGEFPINVTCMEWLSRVSLVAAS